MADIFQLDAHERMTVKECLSHVSLDPGALQDVIVIGYDTDGGLVVRSSEMARKDAVWLLLEAIDYARGE